jgi:hypothetical protein
MAMSTENIGSARSGRASERVGEKVIPAPRGGQVEVSTPRRLPGLAVLIWPPLVFAAHLAGNPAELALPSFWLSVQMAEVLFLAVLPAVVYRTVTWLIAAITSLKANSERLERNVARFLEPASMAASNVVSIRHAVNAELSTLNDQLTRALEKASDIETRIHNEIDSLDRTFGENERRLLSLVQEMARQRETVVVATDQVRDTVRASREELSGELVQMSAQILEAGNYTRGLLEEVQGDLQTVLTGVAHSVAEKVRDVVTSRIDPTVGQIDRQIEKFGTMFAASANGVNDAMESHRRLLGAEMGAAIDRLGSDLDQKSNAALECLRSAEDVVSQSLESAVNRLETRIKSSSLEFLEILDSGGLAAAAKVEDSWQRAARSMSAGIDELKAGLDTRVVELRGVTERAQQTLLPSLEQVSGRMASATELSDMLDKSASRLQQTMSVDAGQFADELTNRLEAFQQQLGQAGQQLSIKLTERLEEALETVDAHAGQLSSALQSVRDTVSVSSDKFAIAASEHNLVATRFASDLGNMLDQGAKELSARLNRELDALEAAMSEGVQHYGAFLSERSGLLAGLLKSSTEAEREQFRIRTSEIEALAAGTTSEIQKVFAMVIADLIGAIERDRTTLETGMRAAAASMAQGSETAASDLEKAATSVVLGIQQHLEAARRDFTMAAVEAAHPLEQAMGELSTEFVKRTSAFQIAMDGRARSIEEAVTDASNRMEEQAGRLQRGVAQRASALERFLNEGSEQLQLMLDQHTERLAVVAAQSETRREQAFGEDVAAMSAALDSRSEALSSMLDARRVAFDSQVQTVARQIEQNLTEIGSRISEGIGSNGGALLSRAGAQMNDFTRDMNGLTSDLREQLLQEATELRGALGGFLGDLSGVLDGEKTGLLAAFDARIAILEKVIGSGIESVGRVSQSETEHLVRRLEGGTQSLRSVLNTETEKLSQGLSGHLQQVRDAITDASLSVANMVRQANRDFEATVTRSTETTTESLGHLSSKLVKQVSSSADQVQQSLSSGSEAVMARLATHEKSAVRRIEQATQAVEESTRRAAEVAVDRLVALNGVVAQVIGNSSSRRPKGPKELLDAAE